MVERTELFNFVSGFIFFVRRIGYVNNAWSSVQVESSLCLFDACVKSQLRRFQLLLGSVIRDLTHGGLNSQFA